MRGDTHRKRQSPFPSYWYCLNKQTTTKTSGWKESSTPELCAYSLVREKSLPEHCDPRTLWPRAEGPLCHIGVCHIPWSGFYWFIGLDLICGKTDSPLTTHKSPPLLSWNLKTYSAILPDHHHQPKSSLRRVSLLMRHQQSEFWLVSVSDQVTLATTNTSTLSNHWELNCKGLSADKDLERVHAMCHLHAKHWGSSLKLYHAQQPNSSTYEYWSKRNERRDWSGGSALESTGCSCRDPGLVLRPPLQLTTMCSSNSGDPMASSGLEKHCIHMMQRHMCRPNTCTHKTNLFKDMSMHVHRKLCNTMKACNGTKLHRKWVRKNIVSGIVCHTKTHP